ncbi:MAG: hypothetical protein DHS20C11_09150 [Lysobacteraceae bacterium]|nr:MAG: hypothetical protein DHS20C11_09150 [Xanthomonadaceae bacterium]
MCEPKMKKAIGRALLLTLLICLLAACGFKLRGKTELPPQMARTELQIQPKYGDLAREVRHILRGQGVTLVDGPSADAAKMRFSENRIEQDVASISAGARIREFDLTYHVTFDVVDAAGGVLVPEQALRLTRNLTYDESQGLGVEQELEFLRQQLVQDMVNLMMLRISTVTEG